MSTRFVCVRWPIAVHYGVVVVVDCGDGVVLGEVGDIESGR